VRLLNEDSPPSSSGSSSGGGSANREPGAGSYQIQITPQDKEAIERVCDRRFLFIKLVHSLIAN